MKRMKLSVRRKAVLTGHDERTAMSWVGAGWGSGNPARCAPPQLCRHAAGALFLLSDRALLLSDRAVLLSDRSHHRPSSP